MSQSYYSYNFDTLLTCNSYRNDIEYHTICGCFVWHVSAMKV
jgi:hypothetical protein